jgi:class 3 adenylate cyclase/tetratricopeptide (TPR) repeat protein
MKCPRCQHENPSSARFCEECATALGSVCPGCGTQVSATAKFCPECAHPLIAAASDARFAAPAAYVPKHLAEKILTSRAALEGGIGSHPSERKQVTVLFADLKGSMELLAERDPEDARKILDPVLERMMEAVHHYEGTVNQVMGDGIMALFGAPVAHEDHAVRACYAALRMQDAVRRYAEELRRSQGLTVEIRVGLNSGDVVVRSIGSDLRMDYTAVGQTTHLAARMEQLAVPGTILITADTLRLAEGFVLVNPLGPVPVKGLESPVEIYTLTGASPARRRLEAAAARGLTRFVGRDTELQALRHALDEAGRGHGQVVAVVGEPGVGKSRLFWEFTRSHRTHGWLVLESGSVSYGKATVYLPVIDLLKAYFKIQDRDDQREIREKVTGKILTLDRALEPTLTPLLVLLGITVGDPAWQALDPRQRRERTLDAVKRLLVRESQVQPLCLVFEDLHWIDSETQGFLDDLIDSLPGAWVLLLVNYRPEYRHGWGSKTCYAQLRIDPLPHENADELLRALLGDDAALEPLRQLLIDRTEGNPFFLEETVRTLVEIGNLVGERGAYRLAEPLTSIRVPATVQAILAARIDRLSPEDKRLLEAAAVIGKDVPLPVLRAVAGVAEDDLRRGLAHLQAGEFIYETSLFPEPEYTFKHALTHEVVYAGLLHDRRKALHARVCDAIERLAGERVAEHAESLARHAVRAEVWDKAVDYLREAGAQAYARGAVQESLARSEQALEILAKLPAVPDNIRRAIDVRAHLQLPLFALGQFPRLVQHLREAERLARDLGDRQRLGRVAITLGYCAFINGRIAETIAYGREALGIAAALGDRALSATCTYELAVCDMALGEFPRAIDAFGRLIEGPDADASRQASGAFGSIWQMACGWLSTCYAERGEFDRAMAHGDRAIQAADASGVPQGQASEYWRRGWTLVTRGEFEAALPWLDRAVRLAETGGLLYVLSIASVVWGSAAVRLGRLTEGLDAVERGVTLQERMQTRVFLPSMYAASADAFMLGGRLPEARRVADAAVELARASGERPSQAIALAVLGAIAAAQEPPDDRAALGFLEQAEALAEELGMRPLLARCHLGLAQMHRRMGEPQETEAHLAVARAMFREMDMRFWLEQAEAMSREPSA